MPWVTLAMIAAQVLAKHNQEQRAIQDASQDAKLNIERQHAASLGGSNYGSEVGQTALNISRARRDAGSNNLGLAIQAIGAANSGSGGKDYASDPKFAKDFGGSIYDAGGDFGDRDIPMERGDYTNELRKAMGLDRPDEGLYA